MSQIESQLKQKVKLVAASKPIIFDLGKSGDTKKLQRLLDGKSVQHVSDDYIEQLRELFAIKNPTLVYTPDFEATFQKFLKTSEKQKPLYKHGRWVYYPWINTAVHLLEHKDFQMVRTARNRNLITPEEQEKYYNAIVGIGGLSVGNSIALAIILQGGARYIRLADFDRLALSNLNRIRAGVDSLGMQKVYITARQIYLLNPYAKVDIFADGLTKNNIEKFFAGPPKLDIVIDELDNLAVKYLIREKAKKHKVALVMGADNGDNAVIDIERYDLNNKIPFFHGRIGKTSYNELRKLDKFGIGKTITKHIGPENVTGRMQDSLLAMGKTIVSWPQLGGAALLNGTALAYAVRRIVNDQPLEKNRILVNMDALVDPAYKSKAEVKKRKKVGQNFKKIFGL